MDVFELIFGKVTILRKDIAEVVINSGVEMDESMVDEFHDFLIAHLRAPFSLLINKTKPYSYTFSAQQKLGTIRQINTIAIVAYSHTAELSSQSLADQTRCKKWNMQIFRECKSALEWLESEQDKT